jgi:hypothetical protein
MITANSESLRGPWCWSPLTQVFQKAAAYILYHYFRMCSEVLNSKLSFFLNRPLFTLRCRGVFTRESMRQLVRLLGRVIGPTQGLYLHRTTQHRHTSMLRAGFEPAILTFERPKTVLASDRSAIEISLNSKLLEKIAANKNSSVDSFTN